jgi:uncharacterized protein YqgC (DUF456 family)
VLIVAGLWIGAWADGFNHVGAITLTIIVLLAVAAHLVDLVAASVGARRVGASRRAAIGAAVGTVVGVFFGVPGIVLGPFVGAVAGELTVSGDLPHVGRVGLAAWLGFIVGTTLKVGLGFLMIGVFVLAMAV